MNPQDRTCVQYRKPPQTVMSVCSACCAVWYCSRFCQRSHWPVHRHCCRPLPHAVDTDAPSARYFHLFRATATQPERVWSPQLVAAIRKQEAVQISLPYLTWRYLDERGPLKVIWCFNTQSLVHISLSLLPVVFIGRSIALEPLAAFPVEGGCHIALANNLLWVSHRRQGTSAWTLNGRSSVLHKSVYSVAGDGRLLAAGCEKSGSIKVWRAEILSSEGKLQKRLPNDRFYWKLTFTKDGWASIGLDTMLHFTQESDLRTQLLPVEPRRGFPSWIEYRGSPVEAIAGSSNSDEVLVALSLAVRSEVAVCSPLGIKRWFGRESLQRVQAMGRSRSLDWVLDQRELG